MHTPSSETSQIDVAIIGAGPVGLFAVFECGMLELKCAVFDTLTSVGGQCTALYPEKPIFDIPAWPRISGRDLIARLKTQAEPFAPDYHLNLQVTGLERLKEGWLLTASDGLQIQASAVIIAAGVGAFGPNRPPLADIEAYEGQSIFYMVGDPEEFRGRRVAIAGGGDSALDWGIHLAGLTEKLFLIHRRDRFRGAPESVAKLHKLVDAGLIELVSPCQLDSLEGADGKLDRVIVRDLDGNRRGLNAEVLLPFFGLSMNLGPIAEWGLELEHKTLKVNPATCETSEPGVYAIGDVATYENKLKLILSGFHEAAMAAHAIYRQVNPDRELHWEYSTSKGVP